MIKLKHSFKESNKYLLNINLIINDKQLYKLRVGCDASNQ